MAVPKKKSTRKRKGNRRASLRLGLFSLKTCSQCGESILPHRVCLHCGYWQGRKVLDIKSKKTKKEKAKAKKKEEEKEAGKAPKRARPLSLEELSKRE